MTAEQSRQLQEIYDKITTKKNIVLLQNFSNSAYRSSGDGADTITNNLLLEFNVKEYIKCDKQISEFDKEVSDCISKIKEFQGNDTNSSSLNYYKDKIKKNKYALDKESDIKSKFQSSFEKDQVKWYNKSIKAYSVKLKMLKDSLQKTKDVGFKAVEYTQQLFTYAQHNKTEYNKLLKIYNELK